MAKDEQVMVSLIMKVFEEKYKSMYVRWWHCSNTQGIQEVQRQINNDDFYVKLNGDTQSFKKDISILKERY